MPRFTSDASFLGYPKSWRLSLFLSPRGPAPNDSSFQSCYRCFYPLEHLSETFSLPKWGHRKVVTSTDTAATWSLNPEKPWAGDRLGPPLFGILFIRNDSRVKLDRFFKVTFSHPAWKIK